MVEDAEFCSCMDPQCASGKRHPDRDSTPVLTQEQWAVRFFAPPRDPGVTPSVMIGEWRDIEVKSEVAAVRWESGKTIEVLVDQEVG